ncbi:single-stranded-DNA-specific exonuclease RecJ [Candidatus Symbiobacter mobilis]|uniref:Single-stranded-DNA-specific exonuclease RecJ n=1 Tax=Candidatus Symbiobacter mobilis CR TaxID=946483 RepID=U5NAL7_9BURK|nr:single-stranded-DNA-specific exonuclease RecJ [Candidatus Symbiobacter mobilis]AGX87244.1 single-stranded-DNA-specific exonuclease [Candidatus Symbiobacter mobilis CR]
MLRDAPAIAPLIRDVPFTAEAEGSGHSFVLRVRDVPPRAVWALEQAGVHPLLARLYASRGVCDPAELDVALPSLLPPSSMRGIDRAAQILADAIEANRTLCVVADYDCDGATACATAVRGLRLLGARKVQYLVPDRVQDGYGLSESLSARAHAMGAEVLLTVDNGIASFAGVAAARALGMQVVVTDHHLCASPQGHIVLPEADAIVNPNQPGCSFASKSMAGVGVAMYLLLAVRAALRARGRFGEAGGAMQPKLDGLLSLVALGTVSDVVCLDANNRRLIAQGLQRIRAMAAPAGLLALFEVAGRAPRYASTVDLGFALGPRINAAGRLSDMTIGIECLLTDDAERARQLARMLDGINRDRKSIEGQMREQALAVVESLEQTGTQDAICLYDPSFHEGVVGIVASRLKERYHRPTFVFADSAAPGAEGVLKGSGRSIHGFHLRDALDLVSKRNPGVLLRFGGHAMAAGCTIARERLGDFCHAMDGVAQECLDEATRSRYLDVDGPFPPEFCRVDLIDTLRDGIWGQGFPAPLFCEELEIVSQRCVAGKHLFLQLRHHGKAVDGVWFQHTTPLPNRATLAFRPEIDTWNGVRKVRFQVEAAVPA